MQELTQTQDDALRAILSSPEMQVFGQNYPAIAAALNDRPLIANSVAQPQIQRHYDLQGLMALLTPSEMQTILQNGSTNFLAWAGTRMGEPDLIFPVIAKTSLLTVIAAIANQGVTGQKAFLDVISMVVALQSRTALLAMASVLRGANYISEATNAEFQLYANTQAPDPTWQAQIEGASLAEQNGLPVLDEHDIQRVSTEMEQQNANPR